MEVNQPHKSPSVWDKNRRLFFRKAIGEAQLEFDRLESSYRIIEAALLTAMGTLGTPGGFNGRMLPGQSDPKIVFRGMDSDTTAFIKDNFQKLHRHYFSSPEAFISGLQADIHIIEPDPRAGDPLCASNLRMLIRWHKGTELTGLMGLSAKLKAGPYMDDEIDWIHHLTDHMMAAIQAINVKSAIHTLENELNQARVSVFENTLRSKSTKKELEKLHFRASGFNDIFNELSNLHESSRVIDAFLLVLMGIFSSRSGLICFWDDDTEETHMSTRGIDDEKLKNITPEMIKTRFDALSGLPQGMDPGRLQAAIVPAEHSNQVRHIPFDYSIAVHFNVDDAAKGILCLGRRLIKTQYGAGERELLLALTHNFLVFLKSSKSFETIARLHAQQEQKNIALEKTIQALSESRSIIAGLEKTGERIKAALAKTITRAARASSLDIALILIAGMVLGLIYNYASPAGIAVVSGTWHLPPTPLMPTGQVRPQLKTQRLILIDARPVEFYKKKHIRDALNLPTALFDFVYMMRLSQTDPNKTIVVYGRNISRHYDREIAGKLVERGHRNVFILSGGLRAWQAEGFEVSP